MVKSRRLFYFARKLKSAIKSNKNRIFHLILLTKTCII
uniref:Uncharacterized protein n=1 Tax=Siphoviridae sp. ctgu013 TaxID=2826421 RepID=A0A8S5NI36_9CAUD|nr:MAG TPA: hypothetical protein [Siphoviridae sp. ctgu013]